MFLSQGNQRSTAAAGYEYRITGVWEYCERMRSQNKMYDATNMLGI